MSAWMSLESTAVSSFNFLLSDIAACISTQSGQISASASICSYYDVIVDVDVTVVSPTGR